MIRKAIEIAVPIGTLAGIRVCATSSIPTAIGALQALRKRYSADIDTNRDAAVSKAMRDLKAALADHERLAGDARRLLAEGEAFEANDFTPLCFLVPDRTDRYRLAKLVLALGGKDVGKEAAKQWLTNYEATYCQRYNVKTLRIR